MLRAAKFAGSEKQLLGTARQLWEELRRVIDPFVVRVDGTLDTIDKQRLIVFLDSQAQHLSQAATSSASGAPSRADARR